METTLEHYFWMLDRLGMEDDSRNKVNTESKQVKLSKQLTSQLINGF